MPRDRPATSGYARIAQEEEDRGQPYTDESDDDDVYQSASGPASTTSRYAPIQPRPQVMQIPEPAPSADHRAVRSHGKRPSRTRSNSGVDIKAINARLERWAEEIASKFKIGKTKGKTPQEGQLEIHYSVFRPPDGVRPATAESLAGDEAEGDGIHITKAQFEEAVESVRIAIEMGIHPKMISQGSSGSYFARNAEGKVVGVFKPKDEEPYASRNPKWTKWIHRNLFPCFFGRACLIPNLSYVSEAAAYVLDQRLRTNLVPYTDIVYLSSKSFHYDFWDRRNFYRRKKPFPQKVGSFQFFLQGFKDANVFLKEHPWPDQHNASFRTDAAPRRKPKLWSESCRPSGAVSEDEEESEEGSATAEEEMQQRRFFWTEALQQSFREELEKLVILDYIMRNTDRGLDNWMIKVDWHTQEVAIVSEPPKLNGVAVEPPSPSRIADNIGLSDLAQPSPYRLQMPMAATSRSTTPLSGIQGPSISIGAIDNSLSWPWKHPDAWRSFPFGWLFLPVSLIGQPFSQKTRDHFLPLLTSTKWWVDTQSDLRRVFSQDSDFQERMFARQIAVMKGQAWNVVETLKILDHGPLELTRRARVCVWDDLVDIPIAVPLRVTSTEMKRRREAELGRGIDEEEMDISAANASASLPQYDLLGLSFPPIGQIRPNDLPNPGRFSLSRGSSSLDGGHSKDDTDDPMSPKSFATVDGSRSEPHVGSGFDRNSHRSTRSETAQVGLGISSGARSSHDGPSSRRLRPAQSSRQRRGSFSYRRSSNALLYDGDDEGDLGYTAAEDMDSNRRKVIVERLETVKSKNPVFTWC
ncbi:MAG: phosphatidyl inositol kinase [Geoglossum simile]|nr:MAG: phosphatidyl inositol kinase [Geoglossum simile]